MYFLSELPLKHYPELSRKGAAQFRKGEVCLRSTRLNDAQDYFEKAVKLFWDAADGPGTALCLLKLGRVLELKGDYGRADGVYLQAASLYGELKDEDGAARCHAFLGSLAWARGNYPESSEQLKKALESFRAANNLPGRAWVHDLIGNLHLALGSPEEAEKAHRAAFALAQETGVVPEGEAWNDYHLGAIALFRNRWDQAEELFKRALGIFRELKDDLGVVATQTHLAEIACDRKDLTAAQENLKEAIRLVLPTQCRPLLADCLTGVAQLLKKKGEEKKALAMLMVALSHPTCRRQTKDRMVSLCQSLEANFSPQELEGGFRWAKEFTIEEMAQSWLNSTNPKTKA